MYSTSGAILTALVVLLCLQITLTTWIFFVARRVARLSRLASLATKRVQAPEQWELRLRELADDVSSLSSSHEKGQRLLTRLNSRAGMRELRSRDQDLVGDAPPPGTSKADLRKHYGVGGITGRAMHHKMTLVSQENGE